MSPYLRFCFISILILPICLGVGCATNLSQAETNPDDLLETPRPTLESENLGQVLPITAKAIMGGETIELEVAQTPEQQSLGLMYRRELADNRGMLFTFREPSIARFWMKNCLISLDMVFLLGDRIKSIAENVPPCTTETCPIYSSDAFVDRVIELRGGRAKELNLKRGDRISLEFLDDPISDNP